MAAYREKSYPIASGLWGCWTEWQWDWRWPCIDTDLSACVIKMHLVSIRTTWFTQQKQWGLFENMDTSSLAAIQRPGDWEDNCKGTGKNEFWASKSYLQWPARKFFSLCPGLAVVTTWEVQHEIPLDLLLQRVVLSIGKEYGDIWLVNCAVISSSFSFFQSTCLKPFIIDRPRCKWV